ncbi:MAG: hypothetical protein MUF25_29255, partial [Pirellulaceae bacterium]|nr:hypothetical protein [Pirellulaceae bacterium]
NNRVAVLTADANRPHQEKVRELYLLAFGREPRPDEVSIAVSHIERNPDPKAAYEDLVWVLLNTKEFLFSH